MEQLSKSKKLARVEVLVIMFVCIFLLGILPFACRKSRSIEYMLTCGTNLASIGKAIQTYTADYDGDFPRAGGESSEWGNRIKQWLADNRFTAYGLNDDGNYGEGSITSSFYLLVKYAGVLPKTFICPGEKGMSEFNPAKYNAKERELTSLWDFGAEPRKHCSYSYHMPYGLYPLTSSSKPGMAIAADPNPWIDSPSVKGKEASLLASYNPDERGKAVKIGNAITHKEDGQNVLFGDNRVSFENFSFCAINDDNIYTYWDGGDIRRGGLPVPGGSGATDRLDSFLVNDTP